VGHENAFVVHGSFYLFPSTKISLFFKMTNKLGIKTNKVVFHYSADGSQDARLGTWQNASLSFADGYDKTGSEPAPRVMGWEPYVS
jgi:hypothetical protein